MKMNIFFTIFFSTMSILMAAPPNWEDDPGAYEFTASMVAVVHDDGIQLDDSNDILYESYYKKKKFYGIIRN